MIKTDFSINNNMVVFSDRILAVCTLEPIDSMLLNQEEKALFEANIRAFLHTLIDDHIQIIMSTRSAKPQDLNVHFNSLMTESVPVKNKTVEELRNQKLGEYIRDLTNLMEDSIIPIREYHLVFKVPADPKNSATFIKSIDRLERLVNKTTNSLLAARIKTKLLRANDLKAFYKQSLQPSL